MSLRQMKNCYGLFENPQIGTLQGIPHNLTPIKVHLFERFFGLPKFSACATQEFIDSIVGDDSVKVEKQQNGWLYLSFGPGTDHEWVLVAPAADIRTPFLTSKDAERPRPGNPVTDRLKSDLSTIIKNPSLRKGLPTKEELQSICDEKGIHYTKKETKPQLAKKILQTL
jgi:hypothetical protein